MRKAALGALFFLVAGAFVGFLPATASAIESHGVVQSAYAMPQTLRSSVSVTLQNQTGNGDLLLVGISEASTAQLAVSDSLGSFWNQIVFNSSTVSAAMAEGYYYASVVNGSDTITVIGSDIQLVTVVDLRGASASTIWWEGGNAGGGSGFWGSNEYVSSLATDLGTNGTCRALINPTQTAGFVFEPFCGQTTASGQIVAGESAEFNTTAATSIILHYIHDGGSSIGSAVQLNVFVDPDAINCPAVVVGGVLHCRGFGPNIGHGTIRVNIEGQTKSCTLVKGTCSFSLKTTSAFQGYVSAAFSPLATKVQVPISILKAGTRIQFACTKKQCSARVLGYKPTGTVGFTTSGGALQCSLTSKGECSVATTVKPTLVSYLGDSNNLPSSVSG